MTRQMHLNKSGSKWASMTACGRNMLRTPLSTDWDEFKGTPMHQRCAKCDASKQAALNERKDEWVPEHPDAWKHSDDRLLAAKR